MPTNPGRLNAFELSISTRLSAIDNLTYLLGEKREMVKRGVAAIIVALLFLLGAIPAGAEESGQSSPTTVKAETKDKAPERESKTESKEKAKAPAKEAEVETKAEA